MQTVHRSFFLIYAIWQFLSVLPVLVRPANAAAQLVLRTQARRMALGKLFISFPFGVSLYKRARCLFLGIIFSTFLMRNSYFLPIMTHSECLIAESPADLV